jgi:hypothetical protein
LLVRRPKKPPSLPPRGVAEACKSPPRDNNIKQARNPERERVWHGDD